MRADLRTLQDQSIHPSLYEFSPVSHCSMLTSWNAFYRIFVLQIQDNELPEDDGEWKNALQVRAYRRLG